MEDVWGELQQVPGDSLLKKEKNFVTTYLV